MKVGFIGVGSIGLPMAEQILKAGHALVVHDVNDHARLALEGGGAKWGDSPADVARQCDIVCTCLPGPTEMEEVVRGPDGLLSSLKEGAVYVDHTTNSPELVRAVHDELLTRGVAMLDAPVSGGAEGAQTRDLTMLVGGDPGVLERCENVMSSMAKTVMHVGEIGSGMVCKLMHNCAGFSLNLAMVECLTVGVKAGVDPDTLVNVFQQCALGRNFDLQVRLPATLFSGDFDPRFALKTAHKDMSLAIELAQSLGVPMDLTSVSKRDMDEAMSRGLEGQDSSSFLTLQEERAGVQIRTSS